MCLFDPENSTRLRAMPLAPALELDPSRVTVNSERLASAGRVRGSAKLSRSRLRGDSDTFLRSPFLANPWALIVRWSQARWTVLVRH